MQPNIVLIMADDMGYSDLGCFGSEIETPNLDRLAQNGARWTQFYNCARCMPSRASLLTGLWPHQAGIGQMAGPQDYGPAYQGYLNEQCVTIGEVLLTAGYTTLMAGKWHVGTGFRKSPQRLPRSRGFDRFWGIPGGAANYFQPNRLNLKRPGQNQVLEDDTPVKAQGYLTDLISDRAVAFVEQYGGDAGKPFFMYVAYTAPHWPLHALPEDIERYKERYLAGWDAVREERYARMQELGILKPEWALTPRDEKAPRWEETPSREWQAHRMAVYAAQIDRMDQGIGRIIAALEAQGILDDTLIMFVSDNGACAEELGDNDPAILPGSEDTWASYGLPWANASNTPFRLYKHWVHEGGISAPFIAHWPKVIEANTMVHQPAHLVDLMATCVDVAGAAYPEKRNDQEIRPLAGRTLGPEFRGEVRAERPLFWEHEGNRAVRLGRWKLVSRFAAGSHNAVQHVDPPEVDESWQLYDMETDRTELHNLAAENPEKVAELTQLYEEWAASVGVRPWRRWQPGWV